MIRYKAKVSARAVAAVGRLPKPVALFVTRQLEALRENPTLLSRRSHLPFAEKCQIMEFDYDHDGRRYFATVLFQYGQDEQTLHILDLVLDDVTTWYE